MKEAGPALRYALILGQGRSGTNHLLNLLNQSVETHCRNEPDQLAGSKLGRLADLRFLVDDPELLELFWDEAVEEAALTIGARDHRIRGPKRWIRPGTARLGGFWLRQRYRFVHRYLRKDDAMFGPEVRFPRWMVNEKKLRGAFHVLKLNAACGHGGWVLENRPEARVLHIVRHPGGFTKSWLRRWVEVHGTATTDREGRDRLRAIVDQEPGWVARQRALRDLDELTPVETELWFWRFVNERLLRAGEEAPGYRRIVFEELAEDPVAVAREVYDFCGLPWDVRIERLVRTISRPSLRIAGAWKDELEPKVVESIERVLEGSELARLWAA